MWRIKIREGKDIEYVDLTDEEYQIFKQASEETKRSFDLVPLNNRRTCSKGDILSEEKVIETDEVASTITFWYGTFDWPNTNTLHGVENWRAYKTDMSERIATQLITGEKDGWGFVAKMLHHFDKFPKELQEHIKRPSTIYQNWDELAKFLTENILRKSDIITRATLVNKFSLNK